MCVDVCGVSFELGAEVVENSPFMPFVGHRGRLMSSVGDMTECVLEILSSCRWT